MTYKVVLTLFRYPGLPRDVEGYKKLGAEFIKIPCNTEEDIITATRDADVVVTALQPYNKRVIQNLQKCRLISVIGIGYEGVDVAAATERGILVANVPGYCVDEVSDHAMALLLACNRKILKLDKAVREGRWDSLEKPYIRFNIMSPLYRLRGQTLGIIGLGRIGRALVPKAKAFGLNILAYDPFVPPSVGSELGVKMVNLEELLRKSDFVSLHAALTPDNRHILGLEQLIMMKPTAYLINTARGGLVDEEALIIALKQGYIAGAALDVTDPEPPNPDSPLLKMDNVIITPHTAFYSELSTQDLIKGIEENIFSVLRGQEPPGLVNPQAKERYRKRFGAL
jgi:D-3-phosphoglycerate dehydrogenase